jgi:hypothetical protein
MGRVMKYVIKPDSGHRLTCCVPTMPDPVTGKGDTCDRAAYDLYKVVVPYGAPGYPYNAVYTFCSERHKMMFVHSHRSLGNLPPGYKLSA